MLSVRNPELLKQDVHVVVGCGGGIGLETTSLLLEDNLNVLGLTHDSKPNNSLVELLNTYPKFNCACGFSYDDQTEDGIKQLLESRIKASHIVVCTGSLNKSIYLSSDDEDVSREIHRNFVYPLSIVRGLAKTMLASRTKDRSITLISSVSTKLGNAGRLSYVASKSALEGAMKVLCNEVGRFGIRVNVVSPGLIDTKMLNDNTDVNEIELFKGRIALGRVGRPREVANVLRFLMSDDASYINGTTIEVNGGIL